MTNTSPNSAVVHRPDGTAYLAPAWQWTEVKEAAAGLVADGIRPQEVAIRCNVNTGTIKEWLRHQEFIARVDELASEFAIRVRQYGIARVECRTAALHELWEPLHKRNVTALNSDGDVDHKSIKSELDIARQASQDLGQWSEKLKLTGDDGGPVQVQAVALAKIFTPAQLQEALDRATNVMPALPEPDATL